ncbi:hypothetical protein UT300013_08990 [Paraclostridium sordellii]|uniref:hypothetical protein n=1 Tax=Paraclostridium sordellii TaxID=1505 RepID=UPI0005DB2661|nr:hypothetical protein [Paeniclostridium sordellii]CEQ08633.1 Uncharacterised protein [[Clostridium] sordellii] [Paeniclostridium sordellii]
MLSNSFQNILDEIKRLTNIEDYKLELILSYIQKKEIHTFIFPENIMKKADLNFNQVIKIFNILEKNKVLKKVYKLYCPLCKDVSQETFNSINELEDERVCEECGRDLYDEKNPYKYIFINFEVARNE